MNQSYTKSKRTLSITIVMAFAFIFIQIFNMNEIKAQNTYSLQFSDASTYENSCGTVKPAQWSVKSDSCTLHTPYFQMETSGCMDIVYEFLINQSGNGDMDDHVYIEYQINGGHWITDTILYASNYASVHTLAGSIQICYGDNIRIRVVMVTNSNTEFWAIKNGAGTVVGSFETYTTEPNPLPVDVSYFKVDCKNYGSLISWGTNSEFNNDFFTIEKSYNMDFWTLVAHVPAGSNSNSHQDYSVPDYLNNNDRIYYRLKQTDINGAYKYYSAKPRECNIINTFDIVNSYSSELKAHITYVVDDDTKPVVIELYNIEGKLISNDSEMPQIGENSKTMNTFDLDKGIYFIVLKQDENRLTSKFLVK